MKKIAINGLGRIGRTALKNIMNDPELQLVAVNDIIPTYQLAYLLNFDTIYGKSENKVSHDEFHLYMNGKQIRVFNIQDPAYLPWNEMQIDVVLECTGKHTRREDLEKHISAGAKHVILAGSSQSEDVITIVNGVNNLDDQEEKDNRIITCATPAANCIAPILEIMSRRIGVKKSIVNTINPYSTNQSLTDAPAEDLRKGRSAVSNFMPGYSDSLLPTINVLPQLQHKLSATEIQVPVSDGSLVDITFITERNTSIEEIHNIFKEEAGSQRYIGVLAVNVDPIVSSDILKDPRASIIDLTMTQVVDGNLVKVMSWYDSEWGFVNQMIKEAKKISLSEMVLS